MSLHPTCLAALCSAALACTSAAGLQWDAPVQTFERVAGDPAVEASFRFRNTGPDTVTVRAVRVTCGCTTAQLDKKTYAPGETGEISVRYKFTSRRGMQRKLVNVFLDDAKEPFPLDLRVVVQEGLTLKPALVFWRAGEPAAAKVIQVHAEPGQPVGIRKVSTSNPRVAARLEVVRAGEEYRVVVEPHDTSVRDAAEVRIETDYPTDAPRTYVAHARVK